ncbi:Hypothetical protein AJAP_42725 (plasmid) [Amycolatopsis japonica]|uniref:Uncharacterized protein n=1 Tax=Amycolatopsis japonica TaxID=208439 RepID=A0A075V4L3_9PSEU|nr:hypothetical protein [Amycolatopsis japonica]AIG81312.1 Hypothetical protein AJAP_42725 [Amycolatopsis japonica]
MTASADTRRFTRKRIEKAVHGGRDLVDEELTLTDRDSDLLDLVVNAILTRLDDPKVDFDGVVEECYEATPKTVRSWWDWT